MDKLFKILILAVFFNALSWIILIPVWQYPDEQAHFAQVQDVAELGHRPTGPFDTSFEIALSEEILGTERDASGNNKYTYHPEYKIDYSNNLIGLREQEIIDLDKTARTTLIKKEATLNPPLYYFLGSIVYRTFYNSSLFTRVYAVRIMSATILLGTVIVAFKIGKLIFENNKVLPFALASFVAFKPMLVFASTGVLPDAMTNLLFSIFTLMSLRVISEGWSTRRITGIGLIIILGAATRQNFLISLFILPFVILHQLIFNKKLRVKIIAAVVIFGAVLFIASYFVPALDFIRRFDYPESSKKIDSNLNYFDHFSWTIRHSITEVWPWYWGAYRWQSLTLPPLVYQVINRLVPLAIIGFVIQFLAVIKKKNFRQSTRLIFLVVCTVIFFMMITTFDYLFRRNNGFSFGIQGRYFFPVIIAQMTLLLLGLSKFFEIILKKFAKFGLFSLVASFFIFNNFSLTYVSATYYSTESLTTFINQASQYKPEIFKGNFLASYLIAAITFQTIFLYKLFTYIIKSK